MTFCENEIVKLDYVNGELDETMRRAFERHLSTCEACRQDVESVRLMASAVRRIPQPTPTIELVEQTRTRLGQTTAQLSNGELLRAALNLSRINLVPNILTPILLAVALTALFVVFHDYIVFGLQRTIELSVPELLWGTATDSPEASLSIPIATLLLILAFLAIPSLFENTRALLARSSAHTLSGNG